MIRTNFSNSSIMSLGRSNLCVIEGRNHLKNFQSWTEAKVKFGSHRNLTRISLTEEETPSTKEDFSVEFLKVKCSLLPVVHY